MRTMPDLTRRRDPDRADCWFVYYGDARVGTIARGIGPNAASQWQWLCGFYPGSHPGEQRGGTAGTFDQARADFEKAWQMFAANRNESDYQAWRDQRDDALPMTFVDLIDQAAYLRGRMTLRTMRVSAR